MLSTYSRRTLPWAFLRCLLPQQHRHASDAAAGHHADYTCIKVGVDQEVGTITICRPKQLNALNSQVRAVCAWPRAYICVLASSWY